MAKWQRLISGKDPGDVDYNNMCEHFSRLSGTDIKYEKHGDMITLYTDGDPEEVLASIIIVGIIVLDTIDAVEYLEKNIKFERNARMN